MLATILHGESLGGGDGWFHPGTSRYGWPWLAKSYGIGAGDRIPRRKWRGPAELFQRLDRDHDGELTAADFDWSENAPATRVERMYKQWLGSIDANGNGKVSREEWEQFFDKLAAGKEHVTVDDLRRAFPLPPAKSPSPPPGMKMPESFRKTLLKGLFESELGSPFAGPRVDQAAPDFTLPTHDGKQTITLSDFRGKKPVVLIFGSFT